MIHKDEYVSWLNQPVTEEFFNTLKEIRDSLTEDHFNGIGVEEHARIAQQIGLIRAYNSVLDYSPNFNDEGYMVDDEGGIIE